MRLIIAGAVALTAIAGAVWFAVSRTDSAAAPEVVAPAAEEGDDLVVDPPPPDPRLTFPTIYRNVKSEIAYIGDARCAACHEGICKSYHAHPMGRSAAKTRAPSSIEKYDTAANNPLKIGPYRIEAAHTAEGIVQRVAANDASGMPLPEYAATADIAIGSGTRGRSYLSLEQGAVWQSPMSWYSHDSRWDLSPGFDLGNGGRRAIGKDCLFCHVHRVDPVPRSQNRYRTPFLDLQAAIGCERCHGPGALHDSERTGGLIPEGMDTSIVNPKHLPSELQSSICAQCHLQGQERVPRRGRDAFEYRPGLPFEQFVGVFVRHPSVADANRSVGQFEQMEQSRCYAASDRRLGCTSCHDPHAVPPAASRESFYRARCNACHQSNGCTAPLPDRQSKQDSCVGCHMPRTGSSNVPHTSITNHRIVRRPGSAAAPPQLSPGAEPLIAFQTGRFAPPEAERRRDLGIALAWESLKLPSGSGGMQRMVAALAEARLSASLKTWRGDSEAWLALSQARAAAGETAKRLIAASTVVRLVPDSDTALAELVEAALAAQKYERAEEAAGKWITQNPTSLEARLARATALMRRGEWSKAETDARAALSIQPLHPTVRVFLAACRHHQGDAAGARKEAGTAAGLATNHRQREEMMNWYRLVTR
jgi:Flp pilus assembly protein TadD